jgi:hypothetical protein
MSMAHEQNNFVACFAMDLYFKRRCIQRKGGGLDVDRADRFLNAMVPMWMTEQRYIIW